ncbi:unnamed protein product [Auanema sp. JU1783]|nr:unnamed protein product [Auanema sp. JU1783]
MWPILLLTLVGASTAFECYTCNEYSNSGRCNEKKTICPPGVDSCSMMVTQYNGNLSVRKFCTQPSTPIYQYLMFFPGSSICQNIDLSMVMPPSNRLRAKRSDSPPAPPPVESPSLLCVCSSPLCNKGSHQEVVENTMFNGIPRRLLKKVKSNFKIEKNTLQDHPDADLFQQMADAGF